MKRLKAILEELWLSFFAWIPTPLGMALRLIAYKLLFKNCGTVRFAPSITLLNCANISLANGVRIGKSCHVTANSGKLEIGKNSAFSPCVHIGADNGSIIIGEHVAVGPNTVIRAANHRFEREDIPIMIQGHIAGEIVIEDDVWIGANCTITPDVRIGRGAIVGAGAVVTRNVSPYTIVAGVPAKVIGRRKE